MIVDSFIFFNEFDVLDIRFEELCDIVDEFVIVETDKTFSGKRKPFHFHQAMQTNRWDKYRDKIRWYSLYMPHDINDPWERESWQRNQLANAIDCYEPNDMIIMSDADEIPNANVIDDIRQVWSGSTQMPLSLWLRKFSYYIDVLTDEQHGSVKVFPKSYLDDRTPQEIRKTDIKPYIMDAGWEFSSLGTAEQIAKKLQSFSHTELDIPGISDVASIKRRMRDLEDVAGRGYKHKVVAIDSYWPKAIRNNPEKWRLFQWTPK